MIDGVRPRSFRIINADNHGLPPYLEHAEEIISELLKIGGRNAPSDLSGIEVGKWIHRERIRKFVTLNRTFREEV